MGFPTKLWRTLKRLAASNKGSTAVELGLILPIIAGMMVPLVDLGMGAYAEMQLQSAVQAGAGNALTSGFNPTAIAAIVQANGTSLSNLQVTPAPTQQCGCVTTSNTIDYSTTQYPPYCSSCPNAADPSKVGVYVTVNATATYTPLFSYPGIGSSVALSAQSVVRIF